MEIKKYLNEIWKDIPDYFGLYQVSNFGRIKGLKRFRKSKSGSVCEVKETILKQRICNHYYCITLYKDGVMTTYKVHRLVATVFIPNPNNFPEINHKDENKLNNRVENLEWCTSEYNANYGNRNKKISHRKNKQILQYDLNGNLLNEFSSGYDAAVYIRNNNIESTEKSICSCCRKEQKTAYGYIWKFKS